MTGLSDTDIRLNSEWQLTQATDGDAPLCSGLECLYQNIVLEALTQPGDVFYDAEFGWGLYARSDALEASWKFIDPILLHWKEEGSKNLFFYEPGEDGPEETVILGAEKKVCACQRR